MIVPDSNPSMVQALTAFRIAHTASLSAQTQAALAEADAQPGGMVMFLVAMEALYAAREDLNDAGKMICAQLGAFCAMVGWPGGDPRPNLIHQVMRRELGEQPPAGLSWPDPEADPPPIKPGGLPGVTPAG